MAAAWRTCGTATLTNCTVSGNSARQRGGGGVLRLRRHDHADRLHRQRQLRHSARLWRRRGQRRHGHADQLHRQRQLRQGHGGGAVYNGGAVTLTNCTVSGNSAGVAAAACANAMARPR